MRSVRTVRQLHSRGRALSSVSAKHAYGGATGWAVKTTRGRNEKKMDRPRMMQLIGLLARSTLQKVSGFFGAS